MSGGSDPVSTTYELSDDAESVFETLADQTVPEMYDSTRCALIVISQCMVHIGAEPSVGETAKRLFKQARESGVLKGRNQYVVAGSAFYIAARMGDQPIKVAVIQDHLTTATGVEKSQSHYRNAIRDIQQTLDVPVPLVTASDHIPQFVMKLVDRGCLSETEAEEITHRAIQLLEEIPGEELSGRSPSGLAAGALYMAGRRYSGEHINQDDLSDISGVSIVTIRNSYNEILDCHQ